MINYSILMTVCNKDSSIFLSQSIESMLCQSQKTNDFVIVCDGELRLSLNECIMFFCNNYNNLFNIIRLDKNVGLGEALQIGVKACKNEYIARMDADDISRFDRCEKEMNFILNNNIAMIGSYVSEFEKNKEISLRIKKVPLNNKEILKYSKRRNPFNHSSVTFKKSIIIKVGNYSKMRTNQDIELWVRLLNKGYVCANLPEPLVYFRFDSNTYKRRKNIKNIILMIKLWFYFFNNKYCDFFDLLYVIIIQFLLFILPKSIIKILYNNYR